MVPAQKNTIWKLEPRGLKNLKSFWYSSLLTFCLERMGSFFQINFTFMVFSQWRNVPVESLCLLRTVSDWTHDWIIVWYWCFPKERNHELRGQSFHVNIFGRQEHTADSLMKALPKGIIEIHRVFDGWPTGSCCVISYWHCYDLETVGHDKGWQSIMCLFALTYWRFELVDWPELLQDKNNLLVDKDAIYMYLNLFCVHTVNIER